MNCLGLRISLWSGAHSTGLGAEQRTAVLLGLRAGVDPAKSVSFSRHFVFLTEQVWCGNSREVF